MKIAKSNLQILIKDSVRSAMNEQVRQKGVDMTGHKNLFIKGEFSYYSSLPDWFKEAKTENAVVSFENNHLTFHKGIWIDGVWMSGTWINGEWKDGLWHRGEWRNGIWYDGIWEWGEWLKGIWHNGTWESGIWHSGRWEGGTWERGIFRKGIHKGKQFYGFDEDGQMIFSKPSK
jgi:hypothetical protein